MPFLLSFCETHFPFLSLISSPSFPSVLQYLIFLPSFPFLFKSLPSAFLSSFLFLCHLRLDPTSSFIFYLKHSIGFATLWSCYDCYPWGCNDLNNLFFLAMASGNWSIESHWGLQGMDHRDAGEFQPCFHFSLPKTTGESHLCNRATRAMSKNSTLIVSSWSQGIEQIWIQEDFWHWQCHLLRSWMCTSVTNTTSL